MMSADPHPVAKFLDLAFDTYEQGDVVLFNAEIAGPGGYYTQLERTFYMGSPRKKLKQLTPRACECRRGKALPSFARAESQRYLPGHCHESIEESGHKMGLHPGHSQGLDIFERPLIDPTKDGSCAGCGYDHRASSPCAPALRWRRLDR